MLRLCGRTIPRLSLPRPFIRFSSTKKRKPKVIQALRTIPTKQSESTANYILSLLNENKQNVSQIEKSDLLAKYMKPLSSVTIGESIDFDAVGELLKREEVSFSEVVPNEVINMTLGATNIMILANGTLVGWGIPEDELLKFTPRFQTAVVEPYEAESEEMDYIDLEQLGRQKDSDTNGGSFMVGEIVIVQSLNPQQRLLDEAAFAIGLSRSTRLSIIESALEKHIHLTRENSENLSKGQKITMAESDVLKLTGRLFLLRGKLNLYSELIETPDLYWTEPSLEKIYDTISKTLDIQPRISILNRKLDYATEEQRALLTVLSEKKGTRLEWIIIILIMVEVCFESFHFYERYSDHVTSN